MIQCRRFLPIFLFLTLHAFPRASSFGLVDSHKTSSHPQIRFFSAQSAGADDSPSREVLDEILQVAVKASAQAAAIIAENSGGSAVVKIKSTSRDLLTTVDPKCEQAIRETIQEHFPHHAILGEEGVAPGKAAAIAALEEAQALPNDFLWIIDPIDGTTNFANGIGLNAPSVAVTYRGEIVVGVIHDPHYNEVWTAVQGRGAQLNGKAVQVNAQATTLGDAVIGCESPAGQESLEVAARGIPVLMPLCRTLRLLGSTAIMLPWVAQGRLTAYWSPDECAWDHAAGALIVQEAGGIVTDLDGTQFTVRTRKFLASQNKAVHQEILRVLREEAGIE